ncbi:MAG: hypothetical protein WA197_12225 [Candidatus Acidiferrales bacterium]
MTGLLFATASSLRGLECVAQVPGSRESARALGAAQDNRPQQPTAETPGIPAPDPRELAENQKAIRKEVQQLYELAADLKSEVDRTDSGKVLSMATLKKAQEIEKLAKNIKNRSKM